MGKGLYSASRIITLRKLIFARFYNTGRINVPEQNHIHRVDILFGNVKCTDIWSSSNTEIFIAGHKCVMSRRQLTSSSAGLLSRALSIFHNYLFLFISWIFRHTQMISQTFWMIMAQNIVDSDFPTSYSEKIDNLIVSM